MNVRIWRPEVGSASGPHGGYATSFTNSFAGTPSAFPVRSLHRQPGTADDSGSGKFAVCCVLTGRYDTPQPVGRPEPNIDYFLITDAASLPAPPGWQRITVPGDDANPLHLSRRLKMNLASLLPSPDSYNAIVYLDGNIEVAGDIRPLVSDYLASGADLGVVPHPFRQCVYEEAAAVMLELRDDPRCVLQAVEFLEHEGHPPRAGLFEMNFFCFRPRPAATAFFAHWWQHYQQHGNRDQLLAPYVARKLGTSLHPLLPTGRSVRTHAAFRYHPHLQ